MTVWVEGCDGVCIGLSLMSSTEIGSTVSMGGLPSLLVPEYHLNELL